MDPGPIDTESYNSGDTYLYGDEYSTASFTATDSETAQLVLWGPADASVAVEVS